MAHLEPVYFESGHVLSHVGKRVSALQKGYRHNMGIIGPEGFGKSHFLQSVVMHFGSEADLLPIIFDAEVLNFDHFASRWIGVHLAALLPENMKSQENIFLEGIDALSANILSSHPKVYEKIGYLRKLLKKNERHSVILKELFSLTAVLASESGKKIIFMIDEFHHLESLGISDPFAWLGKEIMVAKEILYLVTSSKAEKAREIFRDKLTLLFGNFEVIELVSLGQKETAVYLKSKLPGFCFSRAQIKFLSHLTGGVPVYLELILDQLGASFPQSHFIDPSDARVTQVPNERLMHAVGREIYDAKGRLALIFEKRIQLCRRFGKHSAPYIQGLLAVASGKRKLAQIAAFIDKSAAETQKILDRLTEEEMASKKGSFYCIEDYLFKFWLTEVFERKMRFYGPSPAGAKVRFMNSLEHVFNFLTQTPEGDIGGRIEQLFKEFRNDLVQLDGDKWRCPNFAEVSFRPSHNRFAFLVAKSAKTRWLCQVATAEVREDDVVNFREEWRRYRKKAQKRILIVLGGIDQNAKLLAHELKIQLWGVRQLNQLLDLYNLPQWTAAEETGETHLSVPEKSLSPVS